MIYSYGPPHMAEQKQNDQKQNDQHEHTFKNYVRIRDMWGPKDLPEAMNDREKWQERVRDIRATSTT